MKECILLFSVNDPALKAAVRRAVAPLHIALRAVDPADFACTLGELAAGVRSGTSRNSSAAGVSAGTDSSAGAKGETGTPDPAEAGGAPAASAIPAPMLVFAGLPPAKFNMALQSLRAQKAMIPHKAVLTPTNAAWTPVRLFSEIDAERRAIEQQAAARKAQASEPRERTGE